MFQFSLQQLKIVKSLCVIGIQPESGEVRLLGLVKFTPAMIQHSCIITSQSQLQTTSTHTVVVQQISRLLYFLAVFSLSLCYYHYSAATMICQRRFTVEGPSL